MTLSNGNIFRVTGHLCGEFTGPGKFPPQRPVTRSFDVSFDLRPKKRLSKQWWGWWFKTQSHPLWRQCNDICDQSLYGWPDHVMPWNAFLKTDNFKGRNSFTGDRWIFPLRKPVICHNAIMGYIYYCKQPLAIDNICDPQTSDYMRTPYNLLFYSSHEAHVIK